MSTATSMMPLPPGTANMKVAITSPTDGTKITTNTVTLDVTPSGFNDTCDLAGKPNEAMDTANGHYHVKIDDSLINMYCTPTATLSMQNLKPGTHKITVVPALEDHTEITQNAQSVNIDYEPTNPLPTLTDKTFPGPPTIHIVSPSNGAVLSGTFTLSVQWTNFVPSCDLYGKPEVAGYGHMHANLDTTSGPMMGMGTMMGMFCTKTVQLSTQGLKPGETHTLIAALMDNSHAPLMPAVEDKVTFTVGS